jgi:hypothetical protein
VDVSGGLKRMVSTLPNEVEALIVFVKDLVYKLLGQATAIIIYYYSWVSEIVLKARYLASLVKARLYIH